MFVEATYCDILFRDTNLLVAARVMPRGYWHIDVSYCSAKREYMALWWDVPRLRRHTLDPAVFSRRVAWAVDEVLMRIKSTPQPSIDELRDVANKAFASDNSLAKELAALIDIQRWVLEGKDPRWIQMQYDMPHDIVAARRRLINTRSVVDRINEILGGK